MIMKWLKLVKFHYYLMRNWNFFLALHIIYHEFRGEKKYNINTTGIELFPFHNTENGVKYVAVHVATNYYTLERLMEQFENCRDAGGFADIGCGKGRVMAIAAYYGFDKVWGVEFSEQLSTMAEANIKLVKKKMAAVSFEVINDDALQFSIPPDAGTFFFANPFGEITMRRVIENILESQQSHPRTIRIIYVHPVCKELFVAAGFRQVYAIDHLGKYKCIEGVILEKSNTQLYKVPGEGLNRQLQTHPV
jgi:predicted RNA methylase